MRAVAEPPAGASCAQSVRTRNQLWTTHFPRLKRLRHRPPLSEARPVCSRGSSAHSATSRRRSGDSLSSGPRRRNNRRGALGDAYRIPSWAVVCVAIVYAKKEIKHASVNLAAERLECQLLAARNEDATPSGDENVRRRNARARGCVQRKRCGLATRSGNIEMGNQRTRVRSDLSLDDKVKFAQTHKPKKKKAQLGRC